MEVGQWHDTSGAVVNVSRIMDHQGKFDVAAGTSRILRVAALLKNVTDAAARFQAMHYR